MMGRQIAGVLHVAGCLAIVMHVVAQPRGAHLAGQVLTSKDGREQPARRAVVTLSSDDPATSARSTISDDDGGFAFDGVVEGRYALTAAKPSFLSVQWGARLPGRPGSRLAVKATESLDGVILRLVPGAVISGVVRTATGLPAADIEVHVAKYDNDIGWRFVPQVSHTTAQGIYRIFGLASGRYVVVARPAIAGTGSLSEPSEKEIDDLLDSLVRTGTAGGIFSTSGSADATAKSGKAFVPTFSPGTPLLSQATVIDLGWSEERLDANMDLRPVSTETIVGTVIVPPGAGPPARVRLSLEGEDAFMSALGALPTLVADPTAGGPFLYGNVAPGSYHITATTTAGPFLWASSTVVAEFGSAVGVRLELRPGFTIRGRVTTEASGTVAPDLRQARISVLARRPASTGGGFAPVPGHSAVEVGPAGEFEFDNLPGGVYQLSCALATSAPGRGWQVVSIAVAGQDLMDAPLVLGDNDPPIVTAVLTLSDEHTSLSGELRLPDGSHADDYSVVLVPSDRELRKRSPRRTRLARPDSDGRFSFVDIVPGDYLLSAILGDEGIDALRPQLLEATEPNAVAIHLSPGAQAKQDISLAARR